MAALSQLPFRRLTQLYSDTKQSCDVVTDQEKREDAPELTSLHRKFRIQKNRLIAWGCEWSDTAQVEGIIDESVARAGLTETVTSVLGTIKDVLDEAEHIRCSDASSIDDGISIGGKGVKTGGDRPWSVADRARYEDLANDLTNSIDILYDLSRSRRAFFSRTPQATSTEPPRSHTLPPIKQKAVFVADEYNSSDLTLINPSTTSTLCEGNTSPEATRPRKLDYSDLDLPDEEPPPYSVGGALHEGIGSQPSTFLIGHLSCAHTSTNPWKSDGSKALTVPVLVEYAYFDSAYRDTGVPPPLTRLDTLLSILGRQGNSSETTSAGLLTCVGYFEDPHQSRYGIVYELPTSVLPGRNEAERKSEDLRPMSLLTILQATSRSVLGPNPAPPSSIPPLEDRFRLAYNLVSSFSRVHSEGFLHKDVNSAKVMLFRKFDQSRTSSRTTSLDLRSPYLCSFDLFSEYQVDKHRKPGRQNLYMHPNDPRTGDSHARHYSYQHDLYGLALMLIEIGLWAPMSDIFKAKYSLVDFQMRIEDIWIKRLAAKCGTTYMHAVNDCYMAAARGTVGFLGSDQTPRQLYRRLISRLQRCCLLDESDPVEEERPPPPTNASSQETIRQKSHDLGTRLSNLHSKAKSSASSLKLSSTGKKTPPPLPPPRNKRSTASLPNIPLASGHSSAKPKRSLLASSLERIRSTMSSTELNVENTESDRAESLMSVDTGDCAFESGEGQVEAASVIQRAWRKQNAVKRYKEYRRKIVIIQKQWRAHNRRTSSPTTRSVVPVEQRPLEADATIENVPVPDQSDFALPVANVAPRKKTQLQPLKLDRVHLDQWHYTMLPRLERLVSRALKDSLESISIDLVAMGDSPIISRPTILVTCSSTGKVKAVLSRKFQYDSTVFDLKVRKGKIRRSKAAGSKRKRNLPCRSNLDEDDDSSLPALNPYYQQRPLCGASIGAFRGEHYPPASYGGVILIDDKPFGMTVHHLLDEPSDDEDEASEPEDDATSGAEAPRSSAGQHSGSLPSGSGLHADSPPSTTEMFQFEISDDEDTDSDLDANDSDHLNSASRGLDFSDSESEGSVRSDASTCGDVQGVDAEDGFDVIITQPALQDVEEDFFPSEEDRDDDHIDSHSLGHVHASSGLRRWARNGTVHEIDWALVKLKEDRLQPYNLVQGGKRFATSGHLDYCPNLLEPVCRQGYAVEDDEYPVKVANSEELGSLHVHSFGRTTGLRAGIVGPAMSAVRVKMRRTFSRSWHVLGEFGFGGDSGAWVMDDRSRVCGHVLARCERFHIAYICPMDVLLEDMKRTLRAKDITLPGAEEVPSPVEQHQPHSSVDRALISRMGTVALSDIRRMGAGDHQATPRRMVALNGSPTRMEMVGAAPVYDFA